MKNFIQFINEQLDDTYVQDIVKHYNKPIYIDSEQNHRKLGWSSKQGQYKRFKDLLKIGVENGDSVLDYGCGLGDLFNYISEKYRIIDYYGVDINESFIEKAKKTYGEHFLKINKKEDIIDNYDWVVASGVFTVHTSNNMLYSAIDYLYNHSNKGVSFNLMKKDYGYPVQNEPDSKTIPIRGYNYKETYKYFKEKYKNVKLIPFFDNEFVWNKNNFNEFTIYIYK